MPHKDTRRTSLFARKPTRPSAALRSTHTVQHLWPLLAALALISGCNHHDADTTGKDVDFLTNPDTPTPPDPDVALKLTRELEDLRQECFGNFTNTCTSKNIDFDIAVLKANSTERWIPFNEVKTRAQMIEVFGPNGWALFEESVNSVRDHSIAQLEARRPSFLTLHTRGDDQPLDGGVRAFVGPEDLVPFKKEIERQFIQKLQTAGWKPSPEMAARFGVAPSASPAPPATPPPPSPPAVAVPPEASQPAEVTPAQKQEWLGVRRQVAANPLAYLHDCEEHRVAMAHDLGGQSREEASPGAISGCQQDLVAVRNCMALDPDQGARCYAGLNRDSE